MRRLAALEREAAAAVATIEPHDTAPEQDVAAAGLHFVGVRQRDATEVNDPSLRHVETANAGRVGLELADPVRLDVREPPEAVGEPAPLELRERSELAFVERDDELATELVRDPALVREPFDGFHSLAAQTRLQRPGGVVQPRMDDTRVAPALVASQLRLLLQHGKTQARPRLEQTICGREPDQPAPDDGDVVASSRPVPHEPGL